ncbi:ubiquitin carboxyl-terminal hydrolase 36-like [Contarinia nasturtii]|uniref:ubiquitin carboxyl-terminal hydrolase 36-like n=1 Tax=Contarinia nasturtii TaxID=265458 RepID=UPI0012D4267C|nr:ubiquitin carboxyl-terminal hydrolase 36-like [Contarinia nasturtii]
MNAVLQALFHIRPFTEALKLQCVVEDYNNNNNNDDGVGRGCGECTVCALNKTFDEMNNIAELNNEIIDPYRIRTRLAQFMGDGFVLGQHQDAHEFWSNLIFVAMEKRNRSHVQDVWLGATQHYRLCQACGNASHLTPLNPLNGLTLDIQRSDIKSLSDAIRHYFSDDSAAAADDDEHHHHQLKCTKCQQHTKVTRETRIYSAPRVLCIQLRRFNGNRQRINKTISFDQELNLSSFIATTASSASSSSPPLPPPPILRYRLKSIVNHRGISINAGHYTAIVSNDHHHHDDEAAARRCYYLFDDDKPIIEFGSSDNNNNALQEGYLFFL